MFDSVGKTNDPEAVKRQLFALGFTLFASAGVVGIAIAFAAWKATQYLINEVMEENDMIEVVMDDPMLDELPPPPPPPPPPPSAAPESEPEEVEPTPDMMQEDIQDLDPVIPDKVVDDEVKGEEGGVEGGEEGGMEGGVVGGVQGGVLGGVLGGVRVFHHSEVRVKRRVAPEYPDAAYELNLGTVTCRVRVFIDEAGVPYDVEIEACPKVFHQASRDALLRWRWYPAKVEGDKVKAQFLMAIRYVPS